MYHLYETIRNGCTLLTVGIAIYQSVKMSPGLTERPQSRVVPYHHLAIIR
jgi:hypothetical protein